MGSSESKPQNPQRRNTDRQYNDMQYRTPRGVVPSQLAAHSVQVAPAKQHKKSGLPHNYKNNEGGKDTKQVTHTFQEWEIQRAGNLQEYVTKLPHEEPFDYTKKKDGLNKVQRPVRPEDRAHLMQNPYNDPGAIRTITDKNRNLRGVNYHPPGDRSGFKRAPLEPMDRQGRMMKNQHNDRVDARPTWPPR